MRCNCGGLVATVQATELFWFGVQQKWVAYPSLGGFLPSLMKITPSILKDSN